VERGFRVFDACPGYIAGEIVIEHMGSKMLTAPEVYAVVRSHRRAFVHVEGMEPGEAVYTGFTGIFVGIDLRKEAAFDAVGWILSGFADTGDACFGIQVTTAPEQRPL
jgi:hypothetical protein